MDNSQDKYRQVRYERRRKKKIYRLAMVCTLFLICCGLIAFITYKIFNPSLIKGNDLRDEVVFINEKDNVSKDSNTIPEETNTISENIDTTDTISVDDYSMDIPNRDELIDLTNDYPDLKEILKNSNNYPDDLLELILRNPETIDFVKNFPTKYPTTGKEEYIDITDDYKDGKIPHFLQWDQRWGYYNYGNSPIALSGCGPTALSMVIVGLTGNTDKNPKVVSDFSYEKGYYVDGAGTSWTLMSEGAEALGLKSKVLPLDENIIKSNLRDGKPIIVSVRKGDFTTTGHFIILTGVTDEGKITVNDPNSISRSNKEWDIDVLMGQINNLWAFSV
ncbi:hypothetical protein SH1V18_21970 [Vallitalea longa]|uniref:Peptidase C39-like domain-containing protein n=1 Tax=Vallitalea longa TaxID=2936439 RepID=A0A9W6DFQ6_9FIRM|nr:C39 family peptidase [Vallitalea longa]GKX29717.1 hypothetical protein SH1V18_21970 [Vallitalea longa]